MSQRVVEVIGGPEKAAAQRLIHDANIEWEEYGHKLTDAIPKLCPQVDLTKKKTKAEKKRFEKNRKFTAHVNQQLAPNATLTVLASGELFAQYHRKCLAAFFSNENWEGPSNPQKIKQHSPSERNYTWN